MLMRCVPCVGGEGFATDRWQGLRAADERRATSSGVLTTSSRLMS
ncbi:hypothetical protein JTE90_012991, partial [Oedothorax gibbosus]